MFVFDPIMCPYSGAHGMASCAPRFSVFETIYLEQKFTISQLFLEIFCLLLSISAGFFTFSSVLVHLCALVLAHMGRLHMRHKLVFCFILFCSLFFVFVFSMLSVFCLFLLISVLCYVCIWSIYVPLIVAHMGRYHVRQELVFLKQYYYQYSTILDQKIYHFQFVFGRFLFVSVSFFCNLFNQFQLIFFHICPLFCLIFLVHSYALILAHMGWLHVRQELVFFCQFLSIYVPCYVCIGQFMCPYFGAHGMASCAPRISVFETILVISFLKF